MLLAQKLIVEIVSFSFTIGACVIMRWLLCLSTPQSDWWWFQNLGLWDYMDSLKWYRGTEYLHQVRFNRIVDTTISIWEVENN